MVVSHVHGFNTINMCHRIPPELIIHIHKFCEFDTRRILELEYPYLKDIVHPLRFVPNIEYKLDVPVGIITTGEYTVIGIFLKNTVSYKMISMDLNSEHRFEQDYHLLCSKGAASNPDHSYWLSWRDFEIETDKRSIIGALRIAE